MTTPTNAELVALLLKAAARLDSKGIESGGRHRSSPLLASSLRAAADALAAAPATPAPAPDLMRLAELLREPCDSNDRMTARAIVHRLIGPPLAAPPAPRTEDRT